MKKLVWVLLILIAGLLSAAAGETQRVFDVDSGKSFGADEELLQVIVCPTSGADALFLVCGGEVMAVDVGTRYHTSVLLKALDSIGTRKIDTVLNTHPHGDHVGGMLTLTAEDVEIGRFLTAFPQDCSATGSVQRAVMKKLREAEIPVQHIADGDVLQLGGAVIRVMQHMFSGNRLNDSSVVLLVEYGGCTLLLTADLDTDGELALLKDHPELGHVDIMKAPHHGKSAWKSSFTDTLSPQLVFVTNKQSDATQARKVLSYRHIRTLYTAKGFIRLTTNGDFWLVEQTGR